MVNGLSENIKKLRINHGLNQVELAKQLGVSKQCVSNWENDNILPSIEMLCKVADFFNVSVDYLLSREKDMAFFFDGLSEVEQTHIRFLINDLINKNKK